MMLSNIAKSILAFANNYVYALIIFTAFFSYHYDYKGLKKKGLTKEVHITKGIMIFYVVMLVTLIITKQVVEYKMS